MILSPENATYPFQLARLHNNRMGDVAAAVAGYELTYKLDPIGPDSPIFLSKSYLDLGDGEQALDYANQAIDIVANHAGAIEQKINALIFLDRDTEALKLALETLRNPDSFYRWSRKQIIEYIALSIYLKAGDLDMAESFVAQYHPTAASLVEAATPKTLQEVGDVDGIIMLSSVYQAQG